jgi:hypothetical protein
MRRPFATLAAILIAGPAFGATLNSAPALGIFGSALLNCLIRNVSTGTRTVRIEVLDYAGNVLIDSNDETILPGQMRFLISNPDSVPDGASCRFVVSGSPKHFRASTIYFDSGNEMVLPAE